MSKEEIDFYTECAELAGLTLEEWIKEMNEI